MVFLCFDYLYTFSTIYTINMVLWLEDPQFVDSRGIFWTKLCESRLISMIHVT